jgi:two-component system response regulator HydG
MKPDEFAPPVDPPRADPTPTLYVRLDEVRRRHVVSVLEACDGKRTLAAQILGIDRKTLYRRMRRWHIPG